MRHLSAGCGTVDPAEGEHGVERLDGAAVRQWARAAADLLAVAAPQIDAVNVIPVPDADTGTNVRLTVAGGAARAEAEPPDGGTAVAARALAAGALTAARGSSGVIVSQWLAGFAAALPDEPADATRVAAALQAAAVAAAGAVARPQEGTVLTVARLVGDRVRRAADAGVTLPGLLGPALDEATSELARVSAEHPVLRGAHVVDAGACALLVVLEALDRTLTGRSGAPLDWLPQHGVAADELAAWRAADAGGAYEVMLLVRPDEPDAGSRLRERLGSVGDSVAVVGVDELWHVHVHTDDPAAAIEAARLGSRSQVVVRLVEGAAQQVAAGDDLGLVVATGEPGTARFLATGGAVVVVRCPEEAVTATHLARAVADTGATQVVVLAGDDELAGPARDVADQVPGVSVELVGAPDALSTAVASLAVLGARGSAAARADEAQAAVARLRAADVDAWGDLAPTAEALVEDAAGSAQALTVQHGPGAAYDDAVALREWLEGAYPDLDVVLLGPVLGGPRWRIGVD